MAELTVQDKFSLSRPKRAALLYGDVEKLTLLISSNFSEIPSSCRFLHTYINIIGECAPIEHFRMPLTSITCPWWNA